MNDDAVVPGVTQPFIVILCGELVPLGGCTDAVGVVWAASPVAPTAIRTALNNDRCMVISPLGFGTSNQDQRLQADRHFSAVPFVRLNLSRLVRQELSCDSDSDALRDRIVTRSPGGWKRYRPAAQSALTYS